MYILIHDKYSFTSFKQRLWQRKWFWYNKINSSKHVQRCGAMVKELLATCRWSGFDSRWRCFLFLCTVFFLNFVFNPIFPFGLFSFIDTDDPADHALGSIYVSLEFYFGKWISRALDLHTGEAYGQKKHKQTITLRWTLCSPFWKSSTRDVTSHWQGDWATFLLVDTSLPPARKDYFLIFRWPGWKVAYGGVLRRSEVENIFENKCVYFTWILKVKCLRFQSWRLSVCTEIEKKRQSSLLQTDLSPWNIPRMMRIRQKH